MVSTLVESWRRVAFDTAPYVLPQDFVVFKEAEEARKSRGRKYCHPFTSFRDYIASDAFGQTEDTAFHLGLVPVPYMGDLESASIFVLMLNPGFESPNYFEEEASPEYRESMIRNLRQEPTGFPFPWLDPQFAWTTGFRYWAGKFRDLTGIIRERKKLDYPESLRYLANKLCVVQLVPYYSQGYNLPSALRQLRSKRLAVEYVREIVLERAARGEAMVVVARGSDEWRVRTGDNVFVYPGPQARGASLSMQSDGGEAIARWLGLM